MAYSDFAYYYDELNKDADYDALFACIQKQLLLCDIKSGIIADLGCGTGEMTLRLAKSGYDMISVDVSEDMLCVARDKMYENEIGGVLFLNQDLTKLDLYGTIKGAVCTFDTFNHTGPLNKFKKAIERAALFLEVGCPLIFDMNTLHKHENVLSNNTFSSSSGKISCLWTCEYDKKLLRTKINLTGTEDDIILFNDSFYEYAYSLDEITKVCEGAGLKITSVVDGENFGDIKHDSERYFITAVRT